MLAQHLFSNVVPTLFFQHWPNVILPKVTMPTFANIGPTLVKQCLSQHFFQTLLHWSRYFTNGDHANIKKCFSFYFGCLYEVFYLELLLS
jgi:hypothetical protein